MAMLGGRVLDTRYVHDGDGIAVTVRDGVNGGTLTVYLERSDAARSISPGDVLQLAGYLAFWTPKGAPFTDHPLWQVARNGAVYHNRTLAA